MLRLAADENFNGRITRGLRRRIPDLDLVRIQDTPLKAADDEPILEWAANEDRILLTHDVTTMTDFAYDRLGNDQRMPGIIAVGAETPIGQAIEEITLVVLAMSAEEIDGQVIYVPL